MGSSGTSTSRKAALDTEDGWGWGVGKRNKKKLKEKKSAGGTISKTPLPPTPGYAANPASSKLLHFAFSRGSYCAE